MIRKLPALILETYQTGKTDWLILVISIFNYLIHNYNNNHFLI